MKLGSSRTAVGLAALLLVAGVGCGGKKKVVRPPATTLAPTTTIAPEPFPLTGLPATDPAKLARPALVMKVEGGPLARPQIGLDLADVVYEEIVEGGVTRFLAAFHSTDADPIGPVRSVRPSDPDILAPLTPLFGYSGGTPKFIGLLRATPGITDVGYDKFPDAYPRRRGRAAPHDRFTSTATLYAKAPPGVKPPPRLVEFLPPGTPFTGAGAVPAARLGVVVGITPVEYAFDAATSTWKRTEKGTPHTVEGGAQIAPTNVVLQFTPYQISPGDIDQSGAQVSVARTVGQGDAWFFSGGTLVKGKWSKPSTSTLTTYTDTGGAPIRLLPGRTWVELAAPGARTTIG